MNADTPSEQLRRESPLLRTTDYARVLLWRAQLALAALAVPVSLTVGVVVVGADRDAARGAVAGMATLIVCWVLLLTAGAIWRRRLARRDERNWADGWARVEPLWSERPC